MTYDEIRKALEELYLQGVLEGREHPELPASFLLSSQSKKLAELVRSVTSGRVQVEHMN